MISFIRSVLGFVKRVLQSNLELLLQALRTTSELYELRKYPELKRVYSVFANSPEGRWIIGKNDALNLYKLILKTKPVRILECGTGIGAGTAVMSLALNHVGIGSLISLEQSPKVAAIAHGLIEPSLKIRVQIVCAKPAIYKFDKISRWKYFSGYDWIPQGDVFDFMVIDGPGGWLQDGEHITLECGEVIRLLPYLAEGGKIYIDGRRDAVRTTRRYLSKYLTVLKDDGKFILLERNNKPLKSLDDLEVADTSLPEYFKKAVVI